MKNLLLLMVFLTAKLYAQDVYSSKAFVNTYYHGQKCFSMSNGSYLFYNQDNHELIITIDFAKFKVGRDTIDEWLDDLVDTKLVFRGQLNTDNLLELTHHNSKAIIVNGLMTFNNVAHSHAIELTLFEVAQDGLLQIKNSQDYFDRINANLLFIFSPKEFKINKKPHHLTKKISVAIYRGYLNQFKPGMEFWLEEIK
jgi:hypothetical protein